MSRCNQCGHGDPNMAVLDRENIGVPKRNHEDLNFNLCSSCVTTLVCRIQEALKLCDALESGVADQWHDALYRIRQELHATMLTPCLTDQPKETTE